MSEERRFWRRDHWQLLLSLIILFGAASWFYKAVYIEASTAITHGFGAYYSASRLLSNGELSADIYDPAYFLPLVRQDTDGQAEDIFNANPPTTTLMFLPLVHLPVQQARLIWTQINLGLLFAGLILLWWTFSPPSRKRKNWLLLLIILALALLFKPVVKNFEYGQAYILVFFLLTLATAAFRYQTGYSQSLGGIALSLSLILKTTGWPLLILLAWLRRWRFLAWVISFGLAVFLITLPIFKLDMWLAYGRLLSQTGRSPLICVHAYQTTRSFLCHLFAPEIFWQEAESTAIAIPWPVTPIYLFLGVVCMFILLRLAPNRPDLAFLGFICWGILFLPLGETHHHTVILIPLVWIISNWPRFSKIGRSLFLLAIICYIISFPVNARLYQTGWEALAAYPYMTGAWLIFLGILWHRKSQRIPDWASPR